MKRHFLSILLIAAISIAIYANTLKNGFVYDDYFTITNNTLIGDIRFKAYSWWDWQSE